MQIDEVEQCFQDYEIAAQQVLDDFQSQQNAMIEQMKRSYEALMYERIKLDDKLKTKKENFQKEMIEMNESLK